ncbi:CwfJ C-terminus 1-domain-containing protein-like protein [Lyophyllum atratum]|nr:CwfJ C-terminus 1-domain-containing protein-like protein [Lyophyllum atratum]
MADFTAIKSSSGRDRAHERDPDRKHKKRRNNDDGGRKNKHRKKGTSDNHVQVVDDDPNDDDMWIEKNIDLDGERVLGTDIPTAESLLLTSKAVTDPSGVKLPPNLSTETPIKRDEWMMLPAAAPAIPPEARREIELNDVSMTDNYGEPSNSSRSLGGSVDFFSSLGTDIKRKPRPERPDPDKPVMSSREINKELAYIDFNAPPPAAKPNTPGGPGSQWRMMRLKRVYEAADEEGGDVEAIAKERFGSLEAFEEAKEERRILDEREGKRTERGRGSDRRQPRDSEAGEKRLMFTDIGGSGASSRSSSFRRPGGYNDSAPSTPSPATGPPINRRLDSLRLPSGTGSPLGQSHTPIPSAMTPPPIASTSMHKRALSPSSLNKLQAKVLRAKLMGTSDAEKLEQEYEAESRKANGMDTGESRVLTRTEVLPTLDARGRLYDVGHGKEDDKNGPGNRKKKPEKFDAHDPDTGEIVRYNPDDDTTTLGELLRQERFGAGMADQKNLDAQFARAIVGDNKFENDLEYIDDNAEKLGRQKMRSDAMKRTFAIQDYKKTQKVLATCNFCFREDDSPPRAPAVAMGTRTYLSCTITEELVDGHCLIVPIQHHLNMLEADDDVWDEVRNFMKCLMRMFAEEDKGVVFYETVINLNWQNHTVIECVPLPWDLFEIIPGYFKESIQNSEGEWSQHKKLIDFSERPGGFRRAMVPNLPYFMVQFDHKGEKGYGHVIEGTDPTEEVMDEGEKGGGDFPSYFAAEIIGGVLELEPRRWRRPKRIDFRANKERVERFRKKYDKFDWTGLIGKEGV